MKTIGKINSVISKILSVAMIVLFVWMIVAFSIQVFGRYIFGTGFTWTEELTRYGMIWMVFLGAAWIIINSDHVKVTIIEDALKGIPGNVLNIIQDIIGLLFVAAIFYFSLSQLKIAALGTSANTGMSNAVQYIVFPISMILSIYGYITRIVKRIMNKGYMPPADGEKKENANEKENIETENKNTVQKIKSETEEGAKKI